MAGFYMALPDQVAKKEPARGGYEQMDTLRLYEEVQKEECYWEQTMCMEFVGLFITRTHRNTFHEERQPEAGIKRQYAAKILAYTDRLLQENREQYKGLSGRRRSIGGGCGP